jgi:hypothetical protein
MSNGLSIEASREEAVTLFRAWMADKVLVRIEFRFRALAATFLARVTGADLSELRFMSDDRWSELVLRLPDGGIFRYLDIRDYSTRQHEFEHLIALFFPYITDPDESDQIFFTEVKEPRKAING